MSDRAPGSRVERMQFSNLKPRDFITEQRTEPMDPDRFLVETVHHLRSVGQATLAEICDAIDIGVLRTPSELRKILRYRGPDAGIVVLDSIKRGTDLTKQNVYGLIGLDRTQETEGAESAIV